MIIYLILGISVCMAIYGWLIYKRFHTPFIAKATVEERQNNFTDMMKLALEAAIKL